MKSFIASLLLVASCFAAVSQKSDDLNWTVTNTIARDYTGPIGVTFHDDWTQINDVRFERGFEGREAYLGVWNSTGIAGRKGGYGKTFADEIDIYVGKRWSWDFIHYDLSLAYFFLADMRRHDDDAVTLNQRLSFWDPSTLQIYLKSRSFNEISSRSPERGIYGWAGLSRRLSFEDVDLDLDGSVGLSDGPLRRTPGLVLTRLAADLRIPLNRRISLVPSVVRYTPVGDQSRASQPFLRSAKTAWSLSLVSKF